MKYLTYSLFFFFFSTLLFAQKSNYPINTIADSLKQNANAVVRLNQTDITISSQRKMIIHTKRVVTIYNENGLDAIEASENYSKTTNVNSIEATVYNAFGVEIKKIKRKDFKDQCTLDGVTLFSENRVIYLKYTPTEYPFTIEYESEIETSNTAFIPQWIPITDFFVSIEKSILNVNYLDNLGFKKKEFNFNGFNINKTIDTSTQLSYTASSIPGQKPEDYSPSFYEIFPRLMMGLESFHLENVDGTAKSWKEFGLWYYNTILSGTTDLPEETIAKIKELAKNEKDVESKVKIVYDYLQKKSRYVSIQVGIGGWKPMLAKDVDRLGYGDCKALSNYTKALLNAIDIPSYNTILYGGNRKRDIQEDFVSMQGNHMILCVPNGDKKIWLECTSQDNPFGYQANFTDDREVLIVKPDGGEIVKTTNYQDKDNSQKSIGNYTIDENGNFVGTISIVSEGSQYDRKARIETLQPTDKEARYKEYWDNISNLKIIKSALINDKVNVKVTENLDLSAEDYGKKAGNDLIFVLNAFNPYDAVIKRIRNRKTPFEIQRGFYDEDEITISISKEYAISFVPQNIEIKNKFGEYKFEIIKKDDNNLVYKRTFFLKKGLYQKSEYDEYRLFMEQVNRNDNAKIITTKK